MRVEQNRALVFRTNAPEAVTCVIPRSQLLPTGEVMVYWGYDETRVLNNMGYAVPSPIQRDYEYPGPFTPFKHQRETAGFLSLTHKGFCFDEMGCGKTAAGVWAADYLLRLGVIKRVLVVGPVSILQSVWEQEWFRLLPNRSCVVAYGSGPKRKEAFAGAATIVVTNHDSVKHYRADIEAGGFDLIIVDECNAFKTTTSDRWKALQSLVKPTTRLWLMTGTPASQSPLDAFGLGRLANPSNMPRSLHVWRDMVMHKLTQFKYVPKANARDQVYAALQPAIRHHKKDCLDLPPVVYETRTVEMTPQQRKYYRVMEDKAVIDVGGATVTGINAAVKMLKLLQISCGAVNTDCPEEFMEFDCSSRVKAVMELVEESSNKIIIAVVYRNAMNVLLAALQAEYGVDAVTYINGSVSMGDRTERITAFQDNDNPRIMLIQPKAAAHGITLTRADTTIWFSPTTSYDDFAQLNARMDRTGQVNNMTVVQLEGSPVEVQLNAALRGRKENSTALLEMLGRLT